jgi:hypothetical protein
MVRPRYTIPKRKRWRYGEQGKLAHTSIILSSGTNRYRYDDQKPFFRKNDRGNLKMRKPPLL